MNNFRFDEKDNTLAEILGNLLPEKKIKTLTMKECNLYDTGLNIMF